MTIIYQEKGYRLHEALHEAGYYLKPNTNDEAFDSEGNQSPAIDSIVQGIIDSSDFLPEAKADAENRVLEEAGKRVKAIYPHVDVNNMKDIRGFYNYTTDLYSGGLPLPPRLQALKDLRDIAQTKIAEINALTTWQECDNYDASVGW